MASRSLIHAFRLALLAFPLLGACVPDFSTDLSALREPRLLAVSADPPEAGANKEVTLTALVAVPEGATAPRLDWSLCLARKSLTELGPVNPACLGIEPASEGPGDSSGAGGAADAEPENLLVPLGSGETARARLDKDVCKLFGPLRPPPVMGQPAGRPVDPDVTGGFYQPIVARLGDVPSLGAIRIDCDPVNVSRDEALAYRRSYRTNENPRLDSLSIRKGDTTRELDGEVPFEVKAGSEVTLRAAWVACPSTSECGDGYCTAEEDASNCADDCAAGKARGCPGAESYVWYDRESNRIEPRREAMSVAWYASKGGFESEQTGLDEDQASTATHTSNVWRVGTTVGRATIWVVVRDSRGGQSWRMHAVEIVP